MEQQGVVQLVSRRQQEAASSGLLSLELMLIVLLVSLVGVLGLLFVCLACKLRRMQKEGVAGGARSPLVPTTLSGN
jgi:hypothetical protein